MSNLTEFGGKKLYVVHTDAFEEKSFYDMTDEEIVALAESERGDDLVDVYDCLEEVVGNWNTEEFFYPSSSYMRII